MSFQNWSADTRAIFATAFLTATMLALGILSFLKVWPNRPNGWMLLLGLAAGGLGGLLHEFAQSGGKFVLTKREADGIYLGSLTGMLLGIVAGVIAIQGLFATNPVGANNVQAPAAAVAVAVAAPTPQPSNPTPPTLQSPIAIQAFYTALLAGIGLKGVAEAATGQSISSTPGPLPGNARIPIDLPATPQPPKL